MKHLSAFKICFILFAVLSLIGKNVQAQSPVITTVGGNGTAGYSGDGGTATAAEFLVPSGIAVDKNGNIYFADSQNNRIRKITASTGIITTIAGNGFGAGVYPNGGYTGDGGPAVSAEFFDPTGVAVDSLGNVYVADYGNAAIRRIDASTHNISTVAGGTQGYTGDGGLATSAQLDEPSYVALDRAGNIYVADWGNNVIRKVTVATGIITTYVGDGEGAGYGGGSGDFTGDGGLATSGSLNGPEGIAIDNAGNLYIADAWNNVIRKVDGQTHIISLFAGDTIIGLTGFGGNGGPAISAAFNTLGGLATDAAGNLYICDEANMEVRKVNVSTGIITAFAGNATQGFSGDNGPATSAELFAPSSVAFDATGNMYITDSGNERVSKVAAGPSAVADIAEVNDISIYPNPSNGLVTVKLPGAGYTSLIILNSLGQQVYGNILSNTLSDQTVQINTSNIAQGIYFMEVIGVNGNSTSQIAVQR